MINKNGSATAIGAAMIRAAHQLIDGDQRLLEDPVILQLLDPGTEGYILQHSYHFMEPGALALRTHIVLRSRYTEDCLYSAVREGMRQYVILGAGLDTFAYRQPDWAKNLQIFELDHPASQLEKISRLKKANITAPSNVHYGHVDLESDRLDTSFHNAGIDPSQPVFIACLGVLVYLQKPAVENIFRYTGSLVQGTECIFTISQKNAMHQLPTAASLAAQAGEPWITHFEPGRLLEDLRSSGFSRVNFLTPAEVQQRYFAGNQLRLPLPRKSSLVRAVI